jgi:phosphatidate cytidylyltransferase
MNNEIIKRIISSIILIPLAYYFIIHGSYLKLFFIMICFIISFYEWHMMSKNRSYAVYGYIFLIFSFYAFYELSTERILILFVIIICVLTDIGGYVFGKTFKGPKLTKISPNKTYAGMIGGYVLSIISISIIINHTTYSASLIKILILAILLSTVSQIGDIIISYFKRLSKIKHTGNIIPGHGGLLDRIDGMIFAFPFFFLLKLIGFLNL